MEGEGDCIGVTVGIIHNDKDVFMALGRFQQGAHKIHAHFLKGDSDDGQGNEWFWGRFLQGSALTLGAMVAEVFQLCIHLQPELILDLLKGVLHHQVTAQGVGMDEMHC